MLALSYFSNIISYHDLPYSALLQSTCLLSILQTYYAWSVLTQGLRFGCTLSLKKLTHSISQLMLPDCQYHYYQESFTEPLSSQQVLVS